MSTNDPHSSVLRREHLMRDQRAQLPGARCADAVRAGATGTADDLLVLTWSAADLARERAAGVRVLRGAGIATGMRVANTLPGALAAPGSLLLGDVIEALGCLDVPLGTIETDVAARPAWDLVDRVEPAVMVLDPTTAIRFLAAAPSAPRPWWRGIVWLRTPPAAASPPNVPATAGFSGWQRMWLAVPEVTSFVAYSCSAGRFHPDAGVATEIIDGSTGAILAAGRDGLLALTAGKTARYASSLQARASTTPCACGTPGSILDVP